MAATLNCVQIPSRHCYRTSNPETVSVRETLGIQLRFLRSSRLPVPSPSKSVDETDNVNPPASSNVLTLTTAYCLSPISLNTNGTTPHREHT